MAMGLTSYSQTVECTEESIIFHLDQRNYDRLIEKRNPGALEMLRDIVHTKLTLHFSRLNEDSIPLYRYFLYTLNEKEKDARLNSRTPRTKTPQEMEVNVDNLQKGPLVNMYGPGSVFYLIRKRAKEMKARQRRRQNNQASRFGASVKPAALTVSLGGGKGVIVNPVYSSNVYGGAGNDDSYAEDQGQGSATASMINLYGAADARVVQTSEDQDSIDGGDVDEIDQDWASSDTALSRLEERISRWHSSLPTVQKGTCVIPLHRYQFEEENRPKPGNKVYVKLRSKPKSVSFIAFQNENNEPSSPNEFIKPLNSQEIRTTSYTST